MKQLIFSLISFLFYSDLFLYCLAKKPLDAVVVYSKGEGGYYCQRIPTLYRTISGTLLAMAEGRGKDGRTSCDDWAGTDLLIKRSVDNGATWSPLAVFYSNSTVEETNVIGNAAPVQDKKSGRIWVPFCKNNEEVWMTYSDDDGITWVDPYPQPQLRNSDWKWIGLGPPGGIQLSTGRLLVSGYHTIQFKGDGSISHGHTIYCDDNENWFLGSSDYGRPYLAGESQPTELLNGSVLINARTLTNKRIEVLSNDGGLTFSDAYIPDTLHQPLEGCEGSIIRNPLTNILYYSGPFSTSIMRFNLTIFQSMDEGLTWSPYLTVDHGSSAYSTLQLIPSSSTKRNQLEILYERSEKIALVFDPDEIVYWKVHEREV